MKPTEHLSITERPGTYIVVMSDSRGPTIVVNDGPGARAFRYTSEQAAKLALAVLEAAGGRDALGIDVGNAMLDLREYVSDQERATADAKEQAELEAEALELCNEFIEDMGYDRVDSWDGSVPSKKEAWLAVARRARELAKETTK
ncbi:hypothetical protein [Glutamicibacter creatinolyticus]|uniref:hypothetical protein n=1 Tax=Glutamicibacter creatinolyticus TaxID=162496 RepID=UPI0031E3F665